MTTNKRMLIALPGMDDLEREAQRNGTERQLERSKLAYLSAQHQIQLAHQKMAWAALAIVRPGDFQHINRERMDLIHQANQSAQERAKAFFTDECLGFASEQ